MNPRNNAVRLVWFLMIMLALDLLSITNQAAARPTIPVSQPAEDPPQSFRVLCYHDVRDSLRDTLTKSPESTAIDTGELVRHFSWLQQNGYHPVSLQQIVEARTGRALLPPRALLLTFDDGYQSTYTKVFPLLRQFGFPAVIALVGSWIDAAPGARSSGAPDAAFLSWAQVQEMQRSGLIAVASHSYALHQGLLANPQGNLLPAATTRQFDPASQSYESDQQYAQRIQYDLRRNVDLIRQRSGQAPLAMVWPYGAFSELGVEWAMAAQMPLGFTLEPGPNTPQQPLQKLRRSLVSFNSTVIDLHEMLHAPPQQSDRQINPERALQVDLDYVYDADPATQEANLSALLERVVRLHPSTVYLQAFADPDGDGIADAVYFPNRHLPMRADLFSRVAWQLRTRAHVAVYAWMPVIGFKLPAAHPAASHLVSIDPHAPAAARHNRSQRLSPFDPLARQTILEIYEDLGKQASFAGILFHDDATLSDFEDSSSAALAVYRNEWQLPGSVQAIHADPLLRQRWSEHKTAWLNAFTMELAGTLRRYQPSLMTARNLFAEPVLNPASEEWYAQSLPSFLALYDHVALMAMPQMERADDPVAWMDRLLQGVLREPGALHKTLFELQSRDWRTGRAVDAAVMASQMRRLRLGGVRHLGYYPDDFHRNQPVVEVVAPAFSNAIELQPR